jgi:hypothetical protein
MNEKIIGLIKQLPNPKAAWLAIEKELLNPCPNTFILGGLILETVPEKSRSNPKTIETIYEIATLALDRFQTIYNGDPGEWNNHRLQVRKSVFGWL